MPRTRASIASLPLASCRSPHLAVLVALLTLGAAPGWGADDPKADDPQPAAGSGGASGAGGESGGGAGGASGAGGMALVGPEEWNRAVTPLPEGEARDKRAACGFTAGALPAETLGDQARLGSKIPIDHFVLVMMENRSFDHYFQKLPEAGITDVDVAPADFSNLTGMGKPEAIRPMDAYCIADVNHEWDGVHEQFNGGKMDGFVTSNEAKGQDGARAMTYLTEASAPLTYFLGKTWSISDRHFCSLLGPTWPNRMYFYAASSFGVTKNTLNAGIETTLMDNLDKREIPWRVYKTNTPGAGVFVNTVLAHKDNFVSIDGFLADAQAGNLPPVTYVDPGLLGDKTAQSSQHPPANHQYGEQFLYDVVKAVSESPLWASTALIITHDEHGGFYDHVPPPAACPPDDRPIDEGGSIGKFDRLGIRVPLIVVSPFAKKSHVSHVVTDHTSILRLIESRFQLPAMSNRDANAETLADMFDFDAPPFATPPALPERPAVDGQHDEQCKTLFP
jgi:phospholipase C